MKVKRPLSSNPFKIQSKKSLQLRLNSALNNNKFEQPKRLHTISTYNRPRTTLLQINKKNIFAKGLEENLDVLKLIIETNPNQYNSLKIQKKIKKINPLFQRGTEENHRTVLGCTCRDRYGYF